MLDIVDRQAGYAALLEDLNRAAAVYVGLVRRLPYVKDVLFEGPFPVTARLWTVMDGQPFDRGLRDPIYHAQGEALRATRRPLLEFRLVNLADLEGDLAWVLPAGLRSLLSA